MNPDSPGNRRPEPTPSSGSWQAFPHEPPPVPDHEMLRCIGRGAFGEVWLARTVMGAYRAVKVVYRDAFEHERPYEREFEGIQRFEPVSREHPSQIAILHVGRNEEAGCFYYVMELADDAGSCGRQSAQISPKLPPASSTSAERGWVGDQPQRAPKRSNAPLKPDAPASADVAAADAPRTAARLESTPTDVGGHGGIDSDAYLPRTLKYEQHQRGRLPVDEVLRLGTSLATALDHLHRHGLVHRDIKPSNIIFVNGAPKLADVGLVATVDASMSVAGTPGYMPPEGAGTPKGDLYSLGKVLYELATGQDRAEFPALPNELLEGGEGEALLELSAVLDKACEGDPARRYESAAEMHADLAMIQSGRSVRRSRWLERRQKSLVRGALALFLTALLTTGGLLYWKYTAQEAETALAQRDAALDEVRTALADRDGALKASRKEAYANRVNLAQRELEQGNWRGASALLEDCAPEAGEPDPRGWEWRYLQHHLKSDALLISAEQPQSIPSLALKPDERTLAVARRRGNIELWDIDLAAATWRLSRSLPTHDRMGLVAWAPRGELLACNGEAGVVELRSPSEWEPMHKLRHPPGPMGHAFVFALAFSSDGGTLATLGYSGLALWALPRGELRHHHPHNSSGEVHFYCRGLAFHPKTGHLAQGTIGGQIRIVDVESGEILRSFEADKDQITSLDYSSDGRWLATTAGLQARPIRVWDAETDELTMELSGHQGYLQALAFTADGQRLVACGADQTVRVWDLPSRENTVVLRGSRGKLFAMVLAERGDKAITGAQDGELALWSTVPKERQPNPHIIPHVRDHAVLNREGSRIALLNEDGDVVFWEAAGGIDATWEQQGGALGGGGQGYFGIASAAAGPWLVGGKTSGEIDVWSLATDSVVTNLFFAGAGGRPFLLRFLGGDPELCALIQNTAATSWDTKSWTVTPLGDSVVKIMQDWTRHQRGSWGGVVHGTSLIVGTDDGCLLWYDLITGELVDERRYHQSGPRNRAFSPDDQVMASVGYDGDIVIIDVATREEIRRWNARGRPLENLVFTPDGSRIATGYREDPGVDLWDWESGHSVLFLRTEGIVRGLSFSQDGQRLFAVVNDTDLYIWHTPPR